MSLCCGFCNGKNQYTNQAFYLFWPKCVTKKKGGFLSLPLSSFSREYQVLNCFLHLRKGCEDATMAECGGERKEEHEVEIFQKRKKSSSLKAANTSQINGHPNFGFCLHFYQRLGICAKAKRSTLSFYALKPFHSTGQSLTNPFCTQIPLSTWLNNLSWTAVRWCNRGKMVFHSKCTRSDLFQEKV